MSATGSQERLKPRVTPLNAEIGARVIGNEAYQDWDDEDEEIHPPVNVEGTIISWTDEDGINYGDVDCGGFDSLAAVRWDESANSKHTDGAHVYRIGFAGEYWLALLSGGASRTPVKRKPINGFDEDLKNDGYGLRRSAQREAVDGTLVPWCPQPAPASESRYPIQLRTFWRLHAGDVQSVEALLQIHDGAAIINNGIQPCEFPDSDSEHPWPYCTFDGEYGDTLAMLACRYRHSAMLAMLFRLGASLAIKNEAGETAYSICADPSKQRARAFNDTNGAGFVAIDPGLVLHDGTPDCGVVACQLKSRLVRGAVFPLSSCVAEGAEGMRWLVFNGHSDKEQVDYCEKMVSNWRGVIEARGDIVAAELYCPTKAELVLALDTHFSSNDICGVFAIVHGAPADGAWEAFNPADSDECLRWADIEGAGVYKPSQVMFVSDSCHSALLGKRAFDGFRRQHESGKRTPCLSFLAASDHPQKNFSCMFGLDVMREPRKLDVECCTRVAEAAQEQQTLALEVVEAIDVSSMDFSPWFFFFAPGVAINRESVIYTI